MKETVPIKTLAAFLFLILSILNLSTVLADWEDKDIQTLPSQTSISLVNNKGNIGKTLKQLGSKEGIRSLATSIAMAGLTYGALDVAGVSAAPSATATLMDTVNRHLMRTATQTGISTGLSIAQGTPAKKALKQGLKNVAATVILIEFFVKFQ